MVEGIKDKLKEIYEPCEITKLTKVKEIQKNIWIKRVYIYNLGIIWIKLISDNQKGETHSNIFFYPW